MKSNYNTLDAVTSAFTPVTNLSAEQTETITTVQSALTQAAQVIFDHVPECADRDEAIRSLLQSKFLAVQAITHNWDGASERKAS